MNKKYLIVKGCAGLGNRLITLTSAIEYAKKTNRIIYVDWEDGQFAPLGENAFYKYFQLREVPHIDSIDKINTEQKKKVYPPLFKDENLCKSLYELYFTGESIKLKFLHRFFPQRGKITKLIQHWRPINNNTELIPHYSDLCSIKSLFNTNIFPFGGHLPYNLKEDIVIFADYRPNFKNDIFLNHVKLNAFAESLVFESQKSLFKDNKKIGVHIRYSDKTPNDDFHTLHKTINDIGKEDHLIFLSTDNVEIEKQFKQQNSNLITTSKYLPTLIDQGLHQYAKESKNTQTINTLFQESIIDMWLLSKCDYLIAQKGSSFSLISSILKNQPTKTIFW